MRPDACAWGMALMILAAGTTGCGLRGLLSQELFGPEDAGTDGDRPVDGVGAGDRGDAGAAGDSIDSADAVSGEDVAGGACRDACPVTQFCDETAGVCRSGAGSGMLSGIVTDSCDHKAVAAKVGIAGHRTCSVTDKASYFLSGLPLGTLKLSVAAPGYKLYDATVVITGSGNIHDAALVPDTPGGCAAPAPAPVACVCTEVGCTP